MALDSFGSNVLLDIIEGARIRFHKGQYVEAARTAIVDVSHLAPDMLVNDQALAVAIGTSGLPATGDPHPHLAGLFLATKSGRPEAGDNAIFRIELSYKRLDTEPVPPGDTFSLSVSSTAQQIETMVDKDGDPIIVEFTPPGATVALKQGGVIHPDVASETITLSETAQSADPTAITRVWTNAVNDGAFRYDRSAKTGDNSWRLVNISADLKDGFTSPFATWVFSYTLVKRPEIIAGVLGGHNPQVFYVDDNGDPPDGLDEGVGYKTIPWYDKMDFSNLFGS